MKKKIAYLIVLLMIFSNIQPLFVMAYDYNGINFGSGTLADPVRYKDFRIALNGDKNISCPTAAFTVTVGSKSKNSEETILESDGVTASNPMTASVGDQASIVTQGEGNSAASGSSYYLDRYDWQVTFRAEGTSNYILKESSSKVESNKSFTFGAAGTYNFYLNVRDSMPHETTLNWGNWSANGVHEAIGKNPGPTGSPTDDLYGYWHYAQVQVIVTKDKPAPEFNIKYQGKDVTDNQTAAATVEPSDKKLVLQDMSVPASAADPIISRRWYYWSALNGWGELPGSQNQTTVIINDFDAGLPDTALNKSFKLVVVSSSGADNFKEHTTYFKYATGSITTYYKGIDGSNETDLYTPVIETELPLGTYTRSAKPAPADYTLVSPISQQVKLTATNPNAKIYFYYHKNSSTGGTIVTYYKDKLTDADILPSDTYNEAYGTYEIAAKPAPEHYTLLPPESLSVTLDETHKYVAVIFYYQPDPSLYNRPPVAVIDAPDMVYAGNNFYVSGKKSYDSDGSIKEYLWDYDNEISGNTLGSGDAGYIWLPYGSSGLLKLQVKDNLEATGNTHEYVNVLDPVPIAKIDVTGALKVNRKVTVSALNSIGQSHYPIDHARDIWNITAGSTDLKYAGTLTGPTIDMLFKASGDKPANLIIYNNCIDTEHPNGFSDTDSTVIKIVPDQVPKADFSAPAVVTRNPSDSNKATITVTNTSSSPDGDIIGKAVAMYAYDTDNDDNFEEETWYYSKDGTNWLSVGMAYANMVTSFNIFSISTSSPSNFTLKTNQVGKYRFEMRVMEDIPASQTISSFLTESDYMRNDTFSSKPIAEKVVDVRNVAPSITFQAKKNIPMDLVVLTDYLGYKFDSLVSYINAKKAELLPLGITPTVSYVTDRKTVGERTVYQYAHKRLITVSVSGTAHDYRGDFPYSNTFTIILETLNFFEGEENYPDRSKYTYQLDYSISEEYPYSNGDPTWELYVNRYNYYNGQYQSTTTHKFRLGRGQTSNGLGTWFDYDELQTLKFVINQDYAQTFKKLEQVSSERRAFQGLDVDKVMNVNTPSSNRYLLVSADSFWNTIEINKPLKDNITSRNLIPYLVADSDTLNKVFTLTNFSDIRFINGLRAYEKDGKLYQYSGAVLQELPYAARVYPAPQSSVAVPMHDYTSRHWYSSKNDASYSQVITNNNYTTTISIVNSSITVNGKVLNNVKSLYEIGDFYFAELYTGDIYYFKRYLNTWASSGVYLYYNTYISDFVQLSGAKGIKALKMIPALEYVDTGDIYNPKHYLNAEYFYIQDNNNNVYVAKSIGIYKSSGYGVGGDTLYLSYSDPTAVSNPALVKSSAIDYNLTVTRVQDHYYDTWGTYRTVDRDVVNVEYALTSELSSVLKVDTDVNIYSTKELIPLKYLFNGTKGGIYAAGNYQAALDDIAKDIKATTSSLTNYFLINEPVNYTSVYSDYESDSQYAGRWYFTQDANYFDNSNGVESNAGKYITTPINPFTRVGKYEITLQVRDNPKNDLRFLSDTNESANYYKWSTVVDKLILYVHRKPVALQKITVVNNGNGTYTIRAFDAGSYDLDHSTTRADKGIAAREWRWKEVSQTNWTVGQMNKADCYPDKAYITQLRVRDLEGAWSDYNTIEIDKDNPPVALFNLDNLIIKTNELLKVKDQSFPQSFSTITRWHWIVKKLNADGSVPSTYLQNNIYSNSNNGTGAMAGYDVNVKTDYINPGIGKYRVYLRVKDSNGLWSDGGTDSTTPINLNNYYSQDFEVINPNVPPTVTISRTPTGQLYDDDSVIINFMPLDTDIGQLLNVKLEESKDGGAWTEVYSKSNVASGAVQSFTKNSLQVGTYEYRATVTDPFLAQAQASISFTVVVGYRLSNFRVSIIRDFRLEPYYNDGNDRYPDKPFYVKDMAIDPNTFIAGGMSLVPGFTSLSKGYKFEFKIDSKNFNDSTDTIVITPSFYAYYPGVPATRGTEVDLYWEDSNHVIYKAGQGGHDKWNIITLTNADKSTTTAKDATWRGEYLIPGTAWPVPKGTTAANAAASKLNADIIVNFSIKGYKNGVMKYDYNVEKWPVERTTIKAPYQVGDVIRYDHTKSNLDDIKAYRKY